MWPNDIPAVCLNCGSDLDNRDGKGRGRPARYCGRPCRQAAYRERERTKRQRAQSARPAPQPAAEPDEPTPGSPEEQQLLQLALDAQADLGHLIRVLTPGPRPSAVELVETAEQLRRRVTALSAGLVLNARRRRITWEVLATVLSISPETARRTYHERLVEHQLGQYVTLHPPQGADESDSREEAPPPPPPARSTLRASNRLAPVLSQLQRASGLPLRQLGLRTRVSASYLSRVMAGEAVPTLELTERIGLALGADLDTLRRIWDDERARRRAEKSTDPGRAEPSAPAELFSALRALWQRSWMPSPRHLAATAGGLLSEDDVDHILSGEQLGDWPQIQHLVQTLEGEPAFFRPLWERAAHTARKAPPPPPTESSPEHRVARLLATFGGVFNSADTSPHALLSGTARQRARAQAIRNRITLARSM